MRILSLLIILGINCAYSSADISDDLKPIASRLGFSLSQDQIEVIAFYLKTMPPEQLIASARTVKHKLPAEFTQKENIDGLDPIIRAYINEHPEVVTPALTDYLKEHPEVVAELGKGVMSDAIKAILQK